MRQFRVVVIDDDLEVLRRLPGRISTSKREFEGEVWQVDLSLVYVEIEEDGVGGYRFSPSTIRELGQKFGVRPDLLLVDYGYIDRKVLTYWLERHNDGHAITSSDLATQFLTPVELASTVKEAIAEGTLDSAISNGLKRNLLEFDGRLIIYTMTSSPFIAALGEVEFRRSRIEPAFPNAKVIAIDTRYELYNREEFAAQKHESGFYSHLVGGLIDKEIQIGLLRAMLNRARALKYLRYRRSVIAVGAIVAIGGGVAAVGEFLGHRVTDLLQAGDYRNAAIVGTSGILLAFLIGVLLPYAFGRFMSGLLGTSPEGTDH